MKTRLTQDRMWNTLILALCLGLPLSLGCSKSSRKAGQNQSAAPADSQENEEPRDPPRRPNQETIVPPPIQDWGSVVDLEKRIAIFETVFWEPRDTISMRKMIRDTDLVKDKKILEIGSGSGLISLCCLEAGADSTVATDVNQAAIDNTMFNARRLNWENRLETRLVSLDNPGAFAVIGDEEKFDLILSNPPWEDDQPKSISEFALYDPGFKLIDSLLKDLKQHLNPGGKAYLAYGCVSAVKVIQKLGVKYDLQVKIIDERKLEELDEVFLPGMMLEITPNGSPNKDHVEQEESKAPKSAIWIHGLTAPTIA